MYLQKYNRVLTFLKHNKQLFRTVKQKHYKTNEWAVEMNMKQREIQMDNKHMKIYSNGTAENAN